MPADGATGALETSPGGAAPALASLSVPTAFDVGWLLADLRAWAGDHRRASPNGDVPSRLMLPPSPEVKIAQIASKLSLLAPDLKNAGVADSSISSVQDTLRQALARVETDTLAQEHVDSLVEAIGDDLTAASTRMGKALGLGFDLANTCRMRSATDREDARKAFLELFGERVVGVQAALADLASFFPSHAARGVSLSLAEWQYWAGHLHLNKKPVSWPHPGVQEALARQGEVWRTVLAGEKLGQDMLGADDYFTAMKELVRSQFKKRPWIWIALVAVLLLLAASVYLFINQKQTVDKIFAGVTPLLAAVGISTGSLKSFAGTLAREMEAQVWGAELDFAIADAVTVPPGEWRVNLRKIDTPPPRGLDPHIASNARVVRKVSTAGQPDNHQPWPVRRWRLRKYIDRDCVVTLLGRDNNVHNGKRKVAEHLVKNGVLANSRLAHVVTGAPGRAWSLHRHEGNGDGERQEYFLVWTFQRNSRSWLPWHPDVRLIYLDERATDEAARQEAYRPRVEQDEVR